LSWPPHTHALPLPGLARTPPRAPCHAQMLQGHPSELLRRLPIICLEDAVLHPTLLPVAVWLMAAEVGTPCCDSSGCTLFLRLIIVLFGSGQAVALHHSDNLGLVKRFGIGQASPGMGTPEKKPEDECRDNVLPPPGLASLSSSVTLLPPLPSCCSPRATSWAPCTRLHCASWCTTSRASGGGAECSVHAVDACHELQLS